MPQQTANANVNPVALYRTAVHDAATGGAALMASLVKAARTALYAREKAARDLRQRDLIKSSLNLLDQHEVALCQEYAKALSRAFSAPQVGPSDVRGRAAEVNFDELELMDELQVQSSVVLARAQQSALLAAEATLGDLNALICGALGLQSVRADSNPLRPEVYVATLKEVIQSLSVPVAMQLDWIGLMSLALGQELREMYATLSARFKSHGVVPAGYTVRQTGGVSRRAIFQLGDAPTASPVQQRPMGSWQPPFSRAAPKEVDPTLLTLDKLRRLLSGGLEPVAAQPQIETFEQRFAREFEEGLHEPQRAAVDFESTVPAALEALQEMHQVDRVVRTLENRKSGKQEFESFNAQGNSAVRSSLRNAAKDAAQALSLEVVALMVDNIAQDSRLLEPIQRLVRSLEPAYLRLSLVDTRLFTEKQHPARLLLQEITHRSLAYRTAAADGFQEFLAHLQEAVMPLIQMPIDGERPFQEVLNTLKTGWQRAAETSALAREEAVEVLQHVERRNVLAEKIAREIASHRDAASVPTVVMDFLCGPWAQVVAQARISGGASAGNADKYQALISALLWSTQPELTRKNISKLTRLVPLLLSTLREGVETIRYPSTKTAAFLESLMGLHQRAFRAVDGPTDTETPASEAVPAAKTPVLDDEPWVAPEEAKASNFVELPDDTPAPSGNDLLPGLGTEPPVGTAADPMVVLTSELMPQDALPLGSWVELLSDGQWVRTQLTWASPHGTLFLFTSAVGTSQSMTKRSRDRLVASGSLRVISGAPVVDGALNAVAQMALRNSVDHSS